MQGPQVRTLNGKGRMGVSGENGHVQGSEGGTLSKCRRGCAPRYQRVLRQRMKEECCDLGRKTEE
jgi:hypothetical protein